MNLNDFILFDPTLGKSTDIPKCPGNYFVLLREGASIPDLGESLYFPSHRGLDLIYTGKDDKNLRKRIFTQHLGTNAGRSTLRQSLGCLFGYPQIKRDNGKNDLAKFQEKDELSLQAWMKENLLFYFLPNDPPRPLEESLIEELNPPLNLQGNHHPINSVFRRRLSDLRSIKPWKK